MALIPTRTGQGGRLAPRHEHPLDRLQRDFDNLLSRVWGGWLAPSEADVDVIRFWDFDVSDTDKEVLVRAELPGFEENEIDVQINNNVLTIKAEEEQKGDGHREYRSFARAVTLPPGIDAENVQASYRNGVLELHIAKAPQAQPRRIKVSSGPPAATTAGSMPGKQTQPGAAGAASSHGASAAQGGAGTTAPGKAQQ